ncbi:MAG: TetR family transcriptional regulator [Cycloclasticus sp. symbiont of Poecilosclerida sp. M]|nr:MAG: TetR family transcriptional regulator [Cycloclasticus sp. symbiont of Poecilosclerida sp. M]
MDMARNKAKKTKTNKSRGAILDAAAFLFSQHGYKGTTLRDIAAALDMKAGSIYYHFSSKEELVLEILTIGLSNIIDTVVRDVEALPKNSSTKEVLVTAAKAHLFALLEKGDYTSTSIRNYGQMPEAVQKEGLVIRDKYENMWRKWLQQAQDKGEIKKSINLKVLRLSLLGSFNRTLAWYKKGEMSVSDIAESQVEIFWSGIAGDK